MRKLIVLGLLASAVAVAAGTAMPAGGKPRLRTAGSRSPYSIRHWTAR